jgi:hypothetical protein
MCWGAAAVVATTRLTGGQLRRAWTWGGSTTRRPSARRRLSAPGKWRFKTYVTHRHARTQTRTHARTHRRTHTRTHTHTHTHAHAHTRTHTHTHTGDPRPVRGHREAAQEGGRGSGEAPRAGGGGEGRGGGGEEAGRQDRQGHRRPGTFFCGVRVRERAGCGKGKGKGLLGLRRGEGRVRWSDRIGRRRRKTKRDRTG